MKWLIRSVVLVALVTLSSAGSVWGQSATRSLPSVLAEPYQVESYQAQPNTFVPNGTVVTSPGTLVTNPGTVVSSPQSAMTTTAAETFEQKFWNYLVRGKYRNWAPVPGKSDEMYEGESPHGAYLKMYLNRIAAGSPSDLPSGSIVIKENYGKDQRTLMAVTVMYKNNGYSRSTGDWYWVKYNPDGTVATKSTDKGEKRLAGRVKGCIQCHDGADGGDYAFFND